MSISFNKLWEVLIDKSMKKTQLGEQSDIVTSTLAKLGKNKQDSMDILVKICKTPNYNLDDIVDLKNEGI